MKGIILVGAVSETDGLSPISGCAVEIISGVRQRERKHAVPLFLAITNNVGAFTFDEFIPSGHYEINVLNGLGVEIASQGFTANTSDRISLIKISASPGSLEGKVLEADGSPVIGISIILDDDDIFRSYEATTDKNGHYLIDHVIGGKYSVFFKPDGKHVFLQSPLLLAIDGKPVAKDWTFPPATKDAVHGM